jgi:hypothetical protein
MIWRLKLEDLDRTNRLVAIPAYSTHLLIFSPSQLLTSSSSSQKLLVIFGMSQSFTSQKYFTQINLIYFTQAGVMIVFAAVVFALVYSGQFVPTTDQSLADNLTYLLTAVVIAGYAGAHFLYRHMLSRIDKTKDLKQKMPGYLPALLVRSACLELPGMLAAVVLFMTAKLFLFAIPVFTFVVFYLMRPTPATIAEDLHLTDKEKSMLNDPNAIIAER